jgi:hypothetical protein
MQEAQKKSFAKENAVSKGYALVGFKARAARP